MTHILRRIFFLPLIITFSLLLVNVSPAQISPRTLVVFGDSLVAGYGMSLDQAFPAQLEEALNKDGYQIRVVNAGMTGDTSAGGLTRLPWMLKQRADFFILELGANDMLRGTDPAITRGNLEGMLKLLRDKKIPVLLAGMEAAPNLGEDFVESYREMYASLAKEYNATFYPFFMEGVIMHPELIQEDGRHPNEAGVAELVRRILPAVKKMIGKK